jgi:hypothetical protein
MFSFTTDNPNKDLGGAEIPVPRPVHCACKEFQLSVRSKSVKGKNLVFMTKRLKGEKASSPANNMFRLLAGRKR